MTEKNLATLNKEDFTITSTGEAYISQTKAAALTGIPRTTLQDWIYKNSAGLNLNDYNQLDPKSFQKAVMFGSTKGILKSKEILDKLLEAGAKAYLYHQAGYKLQAIEVPKTRVELIEYQLTLAREIEAKEIALEKSQASFKSTRGKLGSKTKEVKSLKRALGISDDYIPVAIMRKKFPDIKFHGATLNATALEIGEDVLEVSSLYESTIVKQYSIKTWIETYPELLDK